MSEVTFQGLEDIVAKLESMANQEKIDSVLGQACALVEASAKSKASKGSTGALRGSITSKVENGEGIVYSPLDYAPYVEYGTGLFSEKGGRSDVPWRYQDDKGDWHTTSGMKAQPFMRPALDENRQAILEILMEGLKE